MDVMPADQKAAWLLSGNGRAAGSPAGSSGQEEKTDAARGVPAQFNRQSRDIYYNTTFPFCKKDEAGREMGGRMLLTEKWRRAIIKKEKSQWRNCL